MQDLSSPTGDPTCAACSENVESSPLSQQRSPKIDAYCVSPPAGFKSEEGRKLMCFVDS